MTGRERRLGWVGLVAILFGSAVSAEAGTLYAIRESDSHLVSIDTVSLAITDIGALGVATGFPGLAYREDTDTLYLAAGRGNPNLYTVDRTTGAATLVGAHGVADLFGLEYHPGTGTLYGTQFAGGSGFYSLDQATGAATPIATMTHQIGGLAYDSTRGQLVGIEDGAGDLYVIDPATGAQTLLFSGDFVNDSGLAYDSEIDVFWDIDYSGNLFRYDPNNGYARTTVLSGLAPHDGLAFVRVIPEPSSLALIGIGLGGLLAVSRRRHRLAA